MAVFVKIERALLRLLRYKGAVGLAGLIVLCALLVTLQILRLPIFAPVGETGTIGLLSLMIRSVFWLAIIAVVVSGVAYVVPARFFIPDSRLEYAVAVFRMINPAAAGLGAITDRFEPYVGFPYYSRESDHPAYWPARVSRDRQALSEAYAAFFGQPKVQAALAAARKRAGDDSSTEVLSSAPGGADPIAAVVASARMFFNFHLNGDTAALGQYLGADLAAQFLAVEEARNTQNRYLPNRIAILRLRNVGRRTVRNVTIEYEVAGYVYDTKVRAVATDTNEPFQPFEHRLVIPRVLPGQSYDVTVWYLYQSVNERVFPDKIHFIQELTQGFTVSNIAVETGGKVIFRRDLLKEVPAYERLYDGDGRPSDNPEQQLAALFEERAAETVKAIDAYTEKHLTVENLTLDELTAFPVEEAQIENVWIEFRSPADKHYRAVCVYEHPKGPYILLSSEDRDESDFVIVRTALAKAIDGEAESHVTDRSDDICSTIAVTKGFTRSSILCAFHALETSGFRAIRVEKLHYTKSAD